MASCLGLYIENNLIKYAKVSKNNDAIKVEAFGVKFYDKIETAIKQIVDETYSFKVPIAINATEEIYNKIEVFSLLSKEYIEGIVDTEFENICYERELDKNIFEQRHFISGNNKQNEKIRIIHIAIPKSNIVLKKNEFSKCILSAILPIGVTITNLLASENKGNNLFVNIENQTIITTVNKNGISNIEVLPFGSREILSNISKRENSFDKAYEICKRTTLYTKNDRDLQLEENDYLEEIMPTLYKIASEIKRIKDDSLEEIDKVYITGTAVVINNIDLYFQETLGNLTCEILRPSFIGNNSKINIKDYIEVNSAISLALQGLQKKSEINFIKGSILKAEVSLDNVRKALFAMKNYIFVTVFTVFLLFIVYILGSAVYNNILDKKISEIDAKTINIEKEINNINNYTNRFNKKITEYESLIKNIEGVNDTAEEEKKFKNAIPNLLNNIMTIIPKSVQLISIDNTTDTHIVIKAKALKYEQISFFKAKLKNDNILSNVVSDTGTVSSDGYVTVTIEGELP